MNKCEYCGCNEIKVMLNMEDYSRQLCSSCYNELMSEELEVDLEQLIETFSLKDYEGSRGTFFVERRIYPMGYF